MNVTELSFPLVHFPLVHKQDYHSDVIPQASNSFVLYVSMHVPVNLFFKDKGEVCVTVRRTRCQCRNSENTAEEKVILCQGDS